MYDSSSLSGQKNSGIYLSIFRRIAILIVFTSFFGAIKSLGQSFDLTTLDFNGNGSVSNGTSLQFGPDGRLYVLQLKGQIKVFTIEREEGQVDYNVTDYEEILSVKNIPNHDDDGSSHGSKDREATGITVAGTADNPVVYVTSSDYRVGGPSGDKNLDTNSGVITRLKWIGNSVDDPMGYWEVVDIVRGLPRSEENHATNGLEFVSINGDDYLIVSSGGLTNAGSPSTKFAYITEYALSGAVLSINLTMLEGMPIQEDPNSGRDYIYDLPTLDDPTRANVNGIEDPNDNNYNGIDINDPWGGNDGLNMSKVVEGGPVQIFSPGYRNTYDLVVTESGAVYVTDNGANGGWGGFPTNEGDENLVDNNYRAGEPGSSNTEGNEKVDNEDHLNLVTTDIQNYVFGSVYGGHPCPVRANPGVPYASGNFPYNPGGAGLYTKLSADQYAPSDNHPDDYFRTQILSPGDPDFAKYSLPVDWPPVPPSLANAADADWRGPSVTNPDGPEDIVVTTWNNNTNGIDEYTASNFDGAMKGNLIAGKSGGSLHRVILNSDGSVNTLEQSKYSTQGGNPLGITCNGDDEIFPGTIWVATFDSRIVILEPNDFVICIQPGEPGYDPQADNDFDGYTNQDEIDNGTDICSGASQPDDIDGDGVSDLNDLDDDGDGINDDLDPFQIGSPSDLPVENELFSNQLDNQGNEIGYLGLGLTGLMNNGDDNPNWLDWLDIVDAGPNPNDILGGAVGAITVNMTGGTASGNQNDQEKGYQFGVNVDQNTGGFTVESRLQGFSENYQLYDYAGDGALGIQIGDGTQSNFIKLVITKSGVELVQEINDAPQTPEQVSIPEAERPASDESITLFMNIDPSTGNVEARYAIGGGAPEIVGSIIAQGNVLNAIQQSNIPLAVGIIGTSNDDQSEVQGTWDYINVLGSMPFIAQQIPDLQKFVNDLDENIELDNYFGDNEGTNNLTYSVKNNSNNAINAAINGSMLTLSFPSSPASSDITILAKDSDDNEVEQSFSVNVTDQLVPLYRVNAGGAALNNETPVWEVNTGNGAKTGVNYSVNTGSISTHNIPASGRHSSIPAEISDEVFTAIFANERWDQSSGDEMEWTFSPVTPGEKYEVRLYMGNGYNGTSSTGQRIFDVEINGNQVIDDLDLSDKYGHQIGAMESYEVTPSGTEIKIKFIHQTENPLINAIEILGPPAGPANISVQAIEDQNDQEGNPVSLQVIASGGQSTLNYNASNLPPGLNINSETGLINGSIQDGAAANSPYNVTVAVDDGGISDPAQSSFSWIVTEPVIADPGDILYRINAGGAQTNDTDKDWDEDQAASSANGTAATGTPSPYVNTDIQDNTYGANVASFTNNTGYPDNIFFTERYNSNTGTAENMQWDFPAVAGNTYIINLLIAEIWTGAQGAPGVRVFDVTIEDELVLDDFDAVADAGWGTAIVKTFTVTPMDDNLDIDFIKNIQNPAIKGIEIIAAADPVVNQWIDKDENENYTGRHECSFVQAGDKFYLFGGREQSQTLDTYNFNTDSWSTSASAPQEFNHFQATEYQGLIWVIGAFKDNSFPSETPAEHIYMFDPANNAWIQGPEIPENRRRGSAGLVVYNDKFYVVGGNTIGHDGGYVNWFDEYDPATNTWTPLADAPHARDHFHATILNGKLYVAGGRLSGGDGGTFAPLVPEVDVYDFSTSTWSTLTSDKNLPTPRAAAATVTFENKVFVIGGEIGVDLDGNSVNDALDITEAYDPASSTWETLASLNHKRHGTQALVSGDGIHLTAGSPNKGGGQQKNMEVYGTDNPTGTPVDASDLTAPSVITFAPNGTQTLTLGNDNGNQGVFVTSMTITGTDASDFEFLNGAIEKFLIPKSNTHDIELKYNATEPGKSASLDITYANGKTKSVELNSEEIMAICVNANGGATTSSNGNEFEADNYFTGGKTYSVNQSVEILNTNDDALYRTERYGGSNQNNANPFSYDIPVAGAGNYIVELHFAEVYAEAAGERLFNVDIEGNTVLEDYDIWATANTANGGNGGKNYAIIESIPVTAADDVINIEFYLGPNGVDNAKVSAICVIPQGGGPVNEPPIVENPGDQINTEGDNVTLQIVASDDNTTDLAYSATGLPPSLSIDVNSGLISGTLDEGTGGTNGAFIEDNGLLTIEIESATLQSNWSEGTDGSITYYEGGNNHFSNQNGGTLNYAVEISTPGVYRFEWRSEIFDNNNTTEHNDSWLKLPNDDDVWFFGYKGSVSSEQQLIDLLEGSQSNIVFPKGSSRVSSSTSPEGAGSNGYFKIYRSGGGGWKWMAKTSDNDAHDIFVWFKNPGTYNLTVSERSQGHKIDKMALYKIDTYGNNYSDSNLTNAAESEQTSGSGPGASTNSPYDVEVTVSETGNTSLSTSVPFTWYVNEDVTTGIPSATVQVNAGGGLGSSTYGNNSFVISNTGDVDILSLTIDASSAFLPDVVFDPVGTAGDNGAKCVTAGNQASPTAVGLTIPANGGSGTDPDCTDPFSSPHNGVDADEGYDVLTLNFNDFNKDEVFAFGVDLDPTSIKGDLTTGDAGSISGFELIGAKVTIAFADGTEIETSLWDEGSMGGSQAVVDEDVIETAPTISVVGLTPPELVNTSNHTLQISGTPGASVTLLQVDSRLFIDPGNPSVGYDVDSFEANEAMAKSIYTGIVLDQNGEASVNVSLLQTSGSNDEPDGGINHFMAVENSSEGATSMVSNILVIEYDPDATLNATLDVTANLQGRTDHSGSYIIELYDPNDLTTPVYSVNPIADVSGLSSISDIIPGDYKLLVKYPNYLQMVETLTLSEGQNEINIGELIAGDANGDNQVSALDFSILSGSFNLQNGDTAFDVRADFNGDGIVSALDFSLLSSNFNTAGESLNNQ